MDLLTLEMKKKLCLYTNILSLSHIANWKAVQEEDKNEEDEKENGTGC